jgi:hypothetical protein
MLHKLCVTVSTEAVAHLHLDHSLLPILCSQLCCHWNYSYRIHTPLIEASIYALKYPSITLHEFGVAL